MKQKTFLYAATYVFALGTLGTAPSALAQTTGPTEADIEATVRRLSPVLRAPELRLNRAQLVRGKPESLVLEALLRIAQDPKERAQSRGRAVTFLKHFPGDKVRNAVVAILRNPNEKSPLVTRRALSLAGRQTPPLVEAIAPFLSRGDYHLREAAVRALKRADTPEARTHLKARLGVEPSAPLQAEIQRHLN